MFSRKVNSILMVCWQSLSSSTQRKGEEGMGKSTQEAWRVSHWSDEFWQEHSVQCVCPGEGVSVIACISFLSVTVFAFVSGA